MVNNRKMTMCRKLLAHLSHDGGFFSLSLLNIMYCLLGLIFCAWGLIVYFMAYGLILRVYLQVKSIHQVCFRYFFCISWGLIIKGFRLRSAGYRVDLF